MVNELQEAKEAVDIIEDWLFGDGELPVRPTKNQIQAIRDFIFTVESLNE